MTMIDTAILMAGKGSRLAPLTDERPKPLIQICGKKLYQYNLEQLKPAGTKLRAVNAWHLADQIAEEFKETDVEVLCENKLRGTGGGISGLKKHLKSDPFIIANSDVVCRADLKSALGDFKDRNSKLSLVVVPNDLGEVWVDNENKIFFIENIRL